jgi:hypothetical protein
MYILLAGLFSALSAVFFTYVFSVWIFRRFRKRTPATWRVARLQHWVLGIGADFLFGFAFAGFFALVGGIGRFNVDQWVKMGFLFGAGCWTAIALPMLLSMSIFVNFHRGVVFGFLLDRLFACVTAGFICAWLLGR